MKKIILIFLLLGSIEIMSQDQTWITDITNEIGLDSAFGSRIWLGDFNNDNFTDLLWGTPKATHNNFNLMINNHSNDIFSRKLENLSDKTGTNYNRRRDNKTGVRTTDIASMADFDNNGTLDIISSIYYHRFTGYKDANDPGDRTEILLNDGNLNFSLAESGLNQIQLDAILPQGLINSTGIAFVDYNLDGLTDAYISTWFTDYYASTADVKQKDILVKNVTVGNDVKFERVYIPAIEAVVEPMYGVNATDWNNDGYQDIVTSPYCRTGGSLFAGGPNGTFKDATAEANYSAQHAKRDGPGLLCQWEANPADFDNDGDMDLLQVIVHGGYYEGMGRTVIAVNQGKDKGYKYEWNLDRIRRDAPLTSHLGDMGACWWDIDNDGKLDMAIGQMSYPTANLQGQERLYILRQNDSGYFDDISKKLGIFYTMKEAHSMEPYDYDLDGDHDLIFSRQVRDTMEVDTVINGQPQKIKVEKVYMKIHLLRNNIGNRNNWIGIKVNPPAGSNKSGIGTRITVWSNGIRYTKDIQAGLGHFANQQSFIQLFGLGQYNRVDSVVIRWLMKGFPESRYYNPPINAYLDMDSSGFKVMDVKTWDPSPEQINLIAFEASHLDFGKVNVGENKEMKFKIKLPIETEKLQFSLKVDSIKIQSNVFEIVEKPTLPFSLQNSDFKEITVKFSPDNRANYHEYIEIYSNAENGKVRKYDLVGFGFEEKPIITLESKSINFDTVHIDTPRTRLINIKNTGEKPLNISSVNLKSNQSGVFSISGFNPSILNRADSLQVNVVFSPKEYIRYTGEIEIKSDAYNEQTTNITLSGYGDGPKPDISVVDVLEFGKINIDEKVTKELEISNKGGGTLELKSIKINFNSDQTYKLIDFNPPYQIKNQDIIKVKVEFNPKNAGIFSKTVDISTNSYFEPLRRITFYGEAVDPNHVDDVYNIKSELYPNPSKDFAYISFEGDATEKDMTIKLFDAAGSEMQGIVNVRICKCDNTYLIYTSNLSNGAYRIYIDELKSYLTEPLIICR